MAGLKIRFMVVGLCVVVLLGCATSANLEDIFYGPDPRLYDSDTPTGIFGGVRRDWQLITWHTAMHGPGGELGRIFALIDLPLSLVADVITLPWTLYAHFCWTIPERPEAQDQ